MSDLKRREQWNEIHWANKCLYFRLKLKRVKKKEWHIGVNSRSRITSWNTWRVINHLVVGSYCQQPYQEIGKKGGLKAKNCLLYRARRINLQQVSRILESSKIMFGYMKHRKILITTEIAAYGARTTVYYESDTPMKQAISLQHLAWNSAGRFFPILPVHGFQGY